MKGKINGLEDNGVENYDEGDLEERKVLERREKKDRNH